MISSVSAPHTRVPYGALQKLTPEERKAYHRDQERLRRKFYPERTRAQDRASYYKVKRVRRRTKSMDNGTRLCRGCELRMDSRFAGMGGLHYCRECKKDPLVKAVLQRIYNRRHRQRKLGLRLEPLVISEKLIQRAKLGDMTRVPINVVA